ncbi:MAG TPA: hypothetical protein VK152_12840 [Paludibacter sp.]|nr:hypothetical protein [Paludibacter sp.]
MKKSFSSFKIHRFLMVVSVAALSVVNYSCKSDSDFFENNIPDWLGSSIYEQLQAGYTYDGVKYTFNTYTKLIDDVGYTEVLRKTGSKTVFVASDEAFERFYKSNPWNVKSYEELTLAQKKLILNSSMINNALLVENLSTIEGPVKGQALRRVTALSVSDTIPLEKGSDLPANSYWDRFRTSGVRLAKDATPAPMLHFLEAQMAAHNITSSDFSILFNGRAYEKGDAYIFNDKVKRADITCQNGYIHILEDVLVPPSNMADVLRTIPEAKVFSSFVERYAAPYYSSDLTEQFRRLGGADSVFVKGYFSKKGITAVPVTRSDGVIVGCKDPSGNKLIPDLLLYDPGYNQYKANDNFQTDMGVIFAPTDDALDTYFKGAGKPLIDMYKYVDSIPNKVLNALVSNHMKPSFLAATPSLFPTVVDDAQEKMGINTSQIQKVYLANNGVVYVTNTVYPPALYSSVMLPASINENMQVIKWAIEKQNFSPYLLSMVNTYSFFIPTDGFTYIVPTSLKSAMPQAWKFHFDGINVYATIHPYDATKPYPECIGKAVSVTTNAIALGKHLEDVLDYHIIVGKIESGKEYYRTKGGGTIRITGDGLPVVAGGGDIERDVTIQVSKIYDQSKETNQRGNGKSYVIDQPLQTPTRSVFSILSDAAKYPEFAEFFKLLQGADDLWTGDNVRATKYSIFAAGGLDYDVRFLNTYHYTLYVPTNDKVREAISNGLPTWDDVAAETDQEARDKKANQIIRFLRYHFQDNAIYVDRPAVSGAFQTATLNLNTDTFYKLKVVGGNNNLSITTGNGDVVTVDKSSGNYNIMARDFKFNTADVTKATTIETSSYVVIHQVDKCMYFDGEFELLKMNKPSLVKRKIRR